MIIAMSRISSRFLDMQNYFPSTNAELKSIAPDHLAFGERKTGETVSFANPDEKLSCHRHEAFLHLYQVGEVVTNANDATNLSKIFPAWIITSSGGV